MPDQTPEPLTRQHLETFVFDPHRADEQEVAAMARELIAARTCLAELESPEPSLKRFGEACRWAAWFAAERDEAREQANQYLSRLDRAAQKLMDRRSRINGLELDIDHARAEAGLAVGEAGALRARVMELQSQVAARDARIAELEASQPFPAGYVTGFLNDQDRVTGLEHVAYPTRVQAVERAEYRRPSIPTVAVYALRKVSDA